MLTNHFDDWNQDNDDLMSLDINAIEETDKATLDRLKVARRRRLEEILESKRLDDRELYYDDDADDADDML